MADNIYLPAGKKAGMPNLSDREPAFVRDEKALYIGTPDGNLKLCEAGTIDKVAELEEDLAVLEETVETLQGNTDSLEALQTKVDGKLSATPAAVLPELTGEEDLAAVISAYNSLIAALKASGIMSSEGVEEDGQTD